MNNLSDVSSILQETFQEFRRTGSITDSVWRRVDQVSIHSLNTGVCILRCSEPNEVKYREIPQEVRRQLRTAVGNQDREALSQNIRQMVEMIAEDPNPFYPVFFITQLKDPLKASFIAFSPFRTRADEENNGPNNPFNLMDVVLNDQGGCDALIKANNPADTFRFAMEYSSYLLAKQTEYKEILDELAAARYEFGAQGSDNLAIVKAKLIQRVRAILADDNNFFLQYMEAVVNQSEDQDPNKREFFMSLVNGLIENAMNDEPSDPLDDMQNLTEV